MEKKKEQFPDTLQDVWKIGDHFSWFWRQYELKFEVAHHTKRFSRSTPGLFFFAFLEKFY